MKRFAHIGLNKKIFIISISILAVSLLLIWLMVYSYFKKMTVQSLEASVQSVLKNQAERIDDFFWRADTISNLLNTDAPTFYTAIQEATDGFAQFKLYIDLLEKFDTLCNTTLGQNISFRSYLILPKEYPFSQLLSASGDEIFLPDPHPSSNIRLINDEVLGHYEWFQNTISLEGETYWFIHPENDTTIWLSTKLNSLFLHNDHVIDFSLGTSLIGIDISWILNQFDENVLMDDAELLIVDRHNRIVFAQDTDLVGTNMDIETENSDATGPIFFHGKSYHLWKQELPGDMHLYFCVPTQTYHIQITSSMFSFALIFLVVLGIGLLATAYFSQFITLPIRKLSAHMDQTSLPTPIVHNYNHKDEISILYNTFNEMLERIYTHSAEQQKWQYQLLQAQINPHFLYNTLDSVGCVALLHNEKQLAKVLSSLAALLRYNINQPEALVTLEDELKMVDNYIKIQQFRYNDCIHYTYYTPDDLLQSHLPKTILQPIVENAINYGYANERGYHYINILVTCDTHPNSPITIRLTNSLADGTDTDKLADQLNQYLLGKCELSRKSSGLGIRNVQQRIAFIFGEQYGIHYEGGVDEISAIVTLRFL